MNIAEPAPVNPNNELPLANITPEGTPPTRRIANAAAAQDLVQRLIQADRERARFNSKIQGMFDGNPPFSATALRNAGQAYRCNVNFLEGKASQDAALTPYYNLFSGSKYFAEVRTEWGNGPEEATRWSNIITEEFDAMLRSYEEFVFNMNSMLYDRIGFGKGYLIWPDKKGWWFNYIPHHKVLVPDATKASLGRLEVLVIRENYLVHQLWGYIKNKETAKKAGWNVSAVVDAIMNAMPDDVASNTNDADAYYYVQDFMRDKDICESVRSSTVQAAHIYVREFSGKVSHCIVMENRTTFQQKNKVEPQYMFEDYECYDKFRNAVAAFFFSTLGGSWNAASGLGRDIFSQIEIKNRLLCSATDNAFLRAGITLQAMTPEALAKTSLVQVGSLNILPDGYEVQQAQILGDVEGLLGMNNALDNILSSNTGVYKSRLEKPTGNPRTAEEVRLQFQNSASLGQSAVDRCYLELDWFYTEIYRRITMDGYKCPGEEGDSINDFYRRCEERGVPVEAIKKVKYVRAQRSLGNGSIFMQQQAILSTGQLVPMMPEEGRSKWLSEAIAVNAGQDAADRWNPQPANRRATDQDWTAMVENGTLKDGAPVVITPTQNNLIHAEIHLQAAAQAAASLKMGGNPAEVMTFLEMVGPHIAEHLQLLEGDKVREAEVKVLAQQWKELASITDQLRKQIGGAIQEQMAEQQNGNVRVDRISTSYKDLPEDVKRQVEVGLGLQPGEESVSAAQENLDIRKHQAQLRTVKQGQDMVIKDVETAVKLKQEAKVQ